MYVCRGSGSSASPGELVRWVPWRPQSRNPPRIHPIPRDPAVQRASTFTCSENNTGDLPVHMSTPRKYVHVHYEEGERAGRSRPLEQDPGRRNQGTDLMFQGGSAHSPSCFRPRLSPLQLCRVAPAGDWPRSCAIYVTT